MALRSRIVVCFALALLALAAAPARAAPPACEGTRERVIAHSVANDEYVVALRVTGPGPPLEGVMVRKLSTDQPVGFAACDPTRRGALAASLGLRACWFTSLRAQATLAGVTVTPDGMGAWELAIDDGTRRSVLLRLQNERPLTLRTMDRAGSVFVAVLADNQPGTCGVHRERAVLIDPKQALIPMSWGGIAPPEPFHAGGDFDAETLRQVADTAARSTLSKLPTQVVVGAARAAAGAYMDDLAECWLQQQVAAMSSDGRQAFWLNLLDDAVLGRFAISAGGRAH